MHHFREHYTQGSRPTPYWFGRRPPAGSKYPLQRLSLIWSQPSHAAVCHGRLMNDLSQPESPAVRLTNSVTG